MTQQLPIDIGARVIALSPEEKDRLFHILEKDIDLFRKIFPVPFLDLVAGEHVHIDDGLTQHYHDWMANR